MNRGAVTASSEERKGITIGSSHVPQSREFGAKASAASGPANDEENREVEREMN